MAQFRKITLTHNGVLSEKAIRAYLEDRLSDEQRRELEAIIADDPFAADAFEGFKSAPKSGEIYETSASLKQKIKDASGAGKQTLRSIQVDWALLGYAAAFIGLAIGIGFIFMLYQQEGQQQQLAVVQNMDSLEVEEIANASPSEAVLDSFSTIDTVTPQLEVSVNDAQVRGFADEIEQEEVKTESKSNLKVAEGDAVVNKKEPAALSYSPSTKPNAAASSEPTANSGFYKQEKAAAPKPAQQNTSPVKELADKKANEDKDMEMANKEKADEERRKSVAVDFDKAMKLFNDGDYKAAGHAFDNIIAKSPDNPEATYFSGVCNYIIGDKPKAEQKFDKLIKRGSYTEGSKWYKANILLNSGKKDDAVKILKQLTGTTGMFKERAVKKLEEIGVE